MNSPLEPFLSKMKEQPLEYFRNVNVFPLSRRDFIAANAMTGVMMETQETVPDGFFNWIKQLLQIYAHMSFLHVKYRNVTGCFEQAAVRSVQYADALIAELDKHG